MCRLTSNCCEALAPALSSNSQHLRELELSNNDSGVKLLSAGLANAHCKLEILRLSFCGVKEEGCASLASALKSNPSHMRELDLIFKCPGDSRERLLSARLKDPHFKLNMDRGECRADKPGQKRYARELTLDTRTVHKLLSLPEKRKVPREKEEYPDHPDIFRIEPQVLCKEELSVRCYWQGSESDGM
uniref:NACHT, LRR and PYD domains-containing protein 3-like n=1 Tax=Oncorhynchus gorbuscha TaxID=8017 RepID=UPI001EAF617D|nr:NACHT, LRR and PYD domains-containing protein 3-like [Oncorhynchus gorbuscha]